MPLRDLIYIDQKRLDSYAEQIASPEKFIKVPKWTVSVGLTGPKIKGEQEQVPTNRTQTEKIELLLKHLKDNHELAVGRIKGNSYFNHPPVFRTETCSVINVYIPLLNPRETGPDTTQLCLSADEAAGVSRLILLQDFRNGDDDGFAASSAYSSLLLLYSEAISRARKYDSTFVSELRNQELSRLGRDALRPSRRGGFGGPYDVEPMKPEMQNPEWIFQEADRRVDRKLDRYFPLADPLDADIQKRFAIDPISVLRDMGAQIGGRKEVEALYRVREVHMEPLPGDHVMIVTFGYPIFIANL